MQQKLRKSSDNKVLTGTLGGIAEYFDLSSTLVRIGYVLASLTTIGMAVFIYIILAIVIPKDYPRDSSYNNRNDDRQQNLETEESEKENEKLDEYEDEDEDEWFDYE